MHRLFLLGALLLAGCQNVVGPFEHRDPIRVDDPLLPIPEQERRGRSELPLPDESPNKLENLAPRTYIDRPGPHGR